MAPDPHDQVRRADTFADIPPTRAGQDPARGGSLWHLRHADILAADTELPAWRSTASSGTRQWHLTSSCSTASTSPGAGVPVPVAVILEAITDGPDELCPCERRAVIDRLALGPAAVSTLRFLIDTDPLPTTPARAHSLRLRLHSQPGPSDLPALDRRARHRADLRWRQLTEAVDDPDFQACALDHLVDHLAHRTAPAPALWTEACQTWTAATRAATATGTPHPRRAVQPLVWDALTHTKAWIRATPAATVLELGCVFAHDQDKTVLLIPAAAHTAAHVVCLDTGADADDIATAMRLQPGQSGEPITTLADALRIARTP